MLLASGSFWTEDSITPFVTEHSPCSVSTFFLVIGTCVILYPIHPNGLLSTSYPPSGPYFQMRPPRSEALAVRTPTCPILGDNIQSTTGPSRGFGSLLSLIDGVALARHVAPVLKPNKRGLDRVICEISSLQSCGFTSTLAGPDPPLVGLCCFHAFSSRRRYSRHSMVSFAQFI